MSKWLAKVYCEQRNSIFRGEIVETATVKAIYLASIMMSIAIEGWLEHLEWTKP